MKKKLKIKRAAPPPPPPPPPRLKKVAAIIPYEEKTWCGCTIVGERTAAHKRDLRVTKYCRIHQPQPQQPPKIRGKKLKLKKKRHGK